MNSSWKMNSNVRNKLFSHEVRLSRKSIWKFLIFKTDFLQKETRWRKMLFHISSPVFHPESSPICFVPIYRVWKQQRAILTLKWIEPISKLLQETTIKISTRLSPEESNGYPENNRRWQKGSFSQQYSSTAMEVNGTRWFPTFPLQPPIQLSVTLAATIPDKIYPWTGVATGLHRLLQETRGRLNDITARLFSDKLFI